MLLTIALIGGRAAAGGGFFLLGPLIFLLVIGLIVFFVARRMRQSGAGPWRRPPSPGLKVLEERYASGEIERDEFIAKRDDLLSRSDTDSS